MLTADGVGALLEAIRPRVTRLRVSDGAQQSAETDVREVLVNDADDDGVPELRVSAVFPSAEANFDWKRTEIVLDDGKVLDADETDLGRKTSASVGSIAVILRLVAPA